MKNLIDYAYQDNGTDFRKELYSAIHDKVAAHIESKKQEIASGYMGKQEESVEELDEAKASAITGTRKIASFDGDHGHTAVVRHSKEYNEYQVHHYKDGKHVGDKSISYHDTKADAVQNAKFEVGLSESDEGKVDCRACDGTGEGRGSGSSCENCRGSGRVYRPVDQNKQPSWYSKKK